MQLEHTFWVSSSRNTANSLRDCTTMGQEGCLLQKLTPDPISYIPVVTPTYSTTGSSAVLNHLHGGTLQCFHTLLPNHTYLPMGRIQIHLDSLFSAADLDYAELICFSPAPQRSSYTISERVFVLKSHITMFKQC